MIEDWQESGFAIYVHWPFCESKCPYCDFNSHVAQNIDQGQWLAAYKSEIAAVAEKTPGRVVNSIFFGGGTPSLMKTDVVGGIIHEISRSWALANDCEITLEANPSSVEVSRLRGYRSAGVNRVSMGFQSLNDADLQRLGRLHSAADALKAYEVACSVFDRVSFDLIYARQDQSLEAWKNELSEALSMSPGHLSLYQLTIEQGTVFGARHERGLLRGLPSENLSADMYLMTQEMCEAAGLPSYEVSNHAQKGAESRHNMIYWTGGDYAGIGPGAHGRLTISGKRFATEAIKAPGAWLKNVSSQTTTVSEMLTDEDQAYEYLIMGMRVSDGIDAKRLHLASGKILNDKKISHLKDLGLIWTDGSRVAATPSGRLLLNAIIESLAEF